MSDADAPLPPALFAPYAPRPQSAPPASDSVISRASAQDLESVAQLTLRRDGGKPSEARDRAKRWTTTSEEERLLLVARVGEAVVGYGRVAWVRGQCDDQFEVPRGWYLGGVVVDEAFRRRGLGAALTRWRLDWIAGCGAGEAYYFVNSINLASIDLHRNFGFVEVRRDFRVPGTDFSGGGVGLLFRAALVPSP